MCLTIICDSDSVTVSLYSASVGRTGVLIDSDSVIVSLYSASVGRTGVLIDSDSVIVLLYSAGVGRTGVLIAMLTAWSYIEAGVAVDMLAIVQQMRDQRPVLIQTPVSIVSCCGYFHCTEAFNLAYSLSIYDYS